MKYSDRLLPQIEEWASKGLTDKQIAINLGVDSTTFTFWKRMRPELAMLLEKAREPLVTEVENKLFQRACGYEYVEVTNEKRGRQKSVKKTKKFIPPDVKAQIFYLTNRQPDKWRFASKIEANVTSMPSNELDLTQLSDEQLKVLSETLKKAHGDSND